MKITYTNAPLPGEHNNGEIWVKWRLDIGDCTIKGYAPTREKAEEAVQKQVDSYAKTHSRFDWATYREVYGAISKDKRSARA